jgi:PAS domain S-box-containing protein
VVITYSDITDLKQVQEKLSLAKDDWERTFDSVPDLIAILDSDHLVRRVNRAMAQRLGLEPEKCIGLPCHEAVHGLSAPPPFCPHSRTIADSLEHVEEVHEDRLGGDFVVSTTPLYDDQGRMTGSVHVAHDITQRKQAEEQTRHLASFPRLNPNPVFEIDASRNILFMNLAAERALQDLGMAKDAADDFLPADMDDILAELGKKEEPSLYREISIKDRVFGATIQLVPWFNVIRIYAYDITERKRAEEALTANLVATTHLQQIGALFVKAGQLENVLGEIVDAAIAITHADMGNIQLFNAQSGSLKIAAYRGFEQPFLDFWNAVAEGQGACGTAMRNAQRAIVEDVAQSPIFVGTPALEVQLAAGVRAVQSTPLFGHSGDLIGMLSTHWHAPHRPEQGDLHLLDLLAQQAVDIIEFARTEDALRTNNEELERLNRAMVGRELRMIELKKEINECCNREGQPPRYNLDFEKEQP